MKTNKDERREWLQSLPVFRHCTIPLDDVRDLIDDVEDATRLLKDVLAEVPSMQWLIEQGGLSTKDAPKFAQMIGDAYVFLEEPNG